MKKLILCCLSLSIYFFSSSQTTTGRAKWKNSRNIIYTYTGQLLNNKPHGWGFAVSDSGNGTFHVFGEFKNGMLEGSAVTRHTDGGIMLANYRENKAEGTGMIVNIGWGDIRYGNFVNGKMEGRVTRIYDDNRILIDYLKNDKSNGNVIEVDADGTTISDNMYVDGFGNGPGYEYHSKTKTMSEGIWENGDWVRETTGNYPSFMRNPNFGSITTDDVIMIYSDITEYDNKKLYHDTCFIFDRKNNVRRFGYFDHGKLRNGLIIRGDGHTTIGQFDENGKQGFCVQFKKEQYLNFGNYKDDKMDGQGITINTDDSTIYNGMLSEGNYTGSAAMLMQNKEIRIGSFINGRMDGEGLVIFPDGRSLTGTYKEGSLTGIKEVRLPNGQKADIHPKDISTAINFLLKEYANGFSTINSGVELNSYANEFNPRYNQSMISTYFFPGASKSLLGVTTKDNNVQQHFAFYAGIGIYKDLESVKKPYEDLCKLLKNCNITSLKKGKILKLIPVIKPLLQENFESGALKSIFRAPLYDAKKTRLIIEVWVQMNFKDGYELVLDIAEDNSTN